MDSKATDKHPRTQRCNSKIVLRRAGDGHCGRPCAPADTKGGSETVRTLDRFDSGNDPHCEHDFCSFEIYGESYFAKMDYYDLAVRYGSEDPSDPTQTTRVLTIMRAEEY
jgi:hypothetical protein